MKIERYGVYLADLRPTRGAEISKIRPVVVVSDDGMNSALQTVVVCPLTTSIHPGWRSRLQMPCTGKDCEIAVDHIRSIAKGRIIKKIDKIDAAIAYEL